MAQFNLVLGFRALCSRPQRILGGNVVITALAQEYYPDMTYSCVEWHPSMKFQPKPSVATV